MALVPLSLALSFVRQDAGADDDVAQAVLEGAEAEAVAFLNRQVYEDQDTLAAAIADGTAADTAMIVNGAIKAAILKTFAEMYSNRTDSAPQKTVVLPFSSRTLLRPFRITPGL
ncbi:head-tail connector protein [Paraburkholderia sp. J8-2]|uniref:head-tail connector protein n=1 Tax=Paraburkholderia sp. J8-2 TaxID=2805440 RepID=UPI002AB623AE|nr:head-tail connector protein [Paraburkholderia sp. J8-2]